MGIALVEITPALKKIAIRLIKDFWQAHNQREVGDEELQKIYENWTREGSRFFLAISDEVWVGFAHLDERGGGSINWLEHIFVTPQYQRRGIGRIMLQKLEDIVCADSSSLYLEVAARNTTALDFYAACGYDCLNTLTLRKDFNKEDFSVISEQIIGAHTYQIKKLKEGLPE